MPHSQQMRVHSLAAQFRSSVPFTYQGNRAVISCAPGHGFPIGCTLRSPAAAATSDSVLTQLLAGVKHACLDRADGASVMAAISSSEWPM